MTSSSATTAQPENKRQGRVLEVLRELLSEGSTPEPISNQVVAMVSQLLARNAELERRLGGGFKNREGVSSAQLMLLLDGLLSSNEALSVADEKLKEAAGLGEKTSVETETTTKPPRQPRGVLKAKTDKLRRVENVIAVEAPDRPCPQCGEMRKCIGHDVAEVVEFIPAEVIVRVDMREKLACASCEAEVIRAPVGDKIVQSGKIGTTLVAQVIVDKYRDGLPLHRQKERFSRLGFPIPVSTLADQVKWAAECLRPIGELLFERVLSSTVMHLDATGLLVLDGAAETGKRLGSLWGFVGTTEGAHTAFYMYNSTGKKNGQRKGELGPEEILAMRNGLTVADASGLFEKSFKREGLIECGCNMHARRYFTRALDAGDPRAAVPLAAFKRIYDIEEEVRGKDSPVILEARQTKTKPVYDELSAWVKVYLHHEPPSSLLGKALSYFTNHEIALRRFLDNPEIPPDNGIVERLHVRTALTRKNYLFAGSDAGAERAAIAYTLIGTCVLIGASPLEYLADVLPKLAKPHKRCDLHALLPHAWLAARSPA